MLCFWLMIFCCRYDMWTEGGYVVIRHQKELLLLRCCYWGILYFCFVCVLSLLIEYYGHRCPFCCCRHTKPILISANLTVAISSLIHYSPRSIHKLKLDNHHVMEVTSNSSLYVISILNCRSIVTTMIIDRRSFIPLGTFDITQICLIGL